MTDQEITARFAVLEKRVAQMEKCKPPPDIPGRAFAAINESEEQS